MPTHKALRLAVKLRFPSICKTGTSICSNGATTLQGRDGWLFQPDRPEGWQDRRQAEVSRQDRGGEPRQLNPDTMHDFAAKSRYRSAKHALTALASRCSTKLRLGQSASVLHTVQCRILGRHPEWKNYSKIEGPGRSENKPLGWQFSSGQASKPRQESLLRPIPEQEQGSKIAPKHDGT